MAIFWGRSTNLSKKTVCCLLHPACDVELDLMQRSRPKLTMERKYRRAPIPFAVGICSEVSPFCLFVSDDQLGYSAMNPFEAWQPLSATSESASSSSAPGFLHPAASRLRIPGVLNATRLVASNSWNWVGCAELLIHRSIWSTHRDDRWTRMVARR